MPIREFFLNEKNYSNTKLPPGSIMFPLIQVCLFIRLPIVCLCVCLLVLRTESNIHNLNFPEVWWSCEEVMEPPELQIPHFPSRNASSGGGMQQEEVPVHWTGWSGSFSVMVVKFPPLYPHWGQGQEEEHSVWYFSRFVRQKCEPCSVGVGSTTYYYPASIYQIGVIPILFSNIGWTY